MTTNTTENRPETLIMRQMTCTGGRNVAPNLAAGKEEVET